MKNPKIIYFKRIGKSSEGYISVYENNDNSPFAIKRCFWTYFTPEEVIRGNHAHFETEMIIIAVSGKIIVKTEQLNGTIDEFILEKPDIGLFIPKLCWHTMKYSHTAVQLVLASTIYTEEDYIRDYFYFKKLKNDT